MRIFRVTLIFLTLAGLLTAGNGNRYAENFTLEPKETYQLLTIWNPLAGNAAEQSFALVSDKDPLPDLPSDYTILRVPLRRMLALETVPLGYLDALRSLEALAESDPSPTLPTQPFGRLWSRERCKQCPLAPASTPRPFSSYSRISFSPVPATIPLRIYPKHSFVPDQPS